MRLLVRMFEEHLLEQVGMIEALRIALQERNCSQCALVGMQLLRFLKLKERRDEKRSGWIDNDDALALLQCAREMDTFDSRTNKNRDNSQEPESCEPVFVDKDANRVSTANILRALRLRSCRS